MAPLAMELKFFPGSYMFHKPFYRTLTVQEAMSIASRVGRWTPVENIFILHVDGPLKSFK